MRLVASTADEEHVLGLEVAVDDALGVRGLERVARSASSDRRSASSDGERARAQTRAARLSPSSYSITK